MDIYEAIRQLNPSVVTLKGDEEIIAYDSENNEVSYDRTTADNLVASKQYQVDRQYPSIQEQLDMQYWDAVNGTTTWKDAIAQVKADNPKPE